MDSKTTIAQIRKWAKKTRDDRNWNPSSRSLAISLSLEVNELLEHFQWSESEKVEEDVKNDLKRREDIESEVADILNYLCEFADKFNIDLSSSLKKKLKKIEEKYPVDKLKKYGSKFYYSQKAKYRKGKK